MAEPSAVAAHPAPSPRFRSPSRRRKPSLPLHCPRFPSLMRRTAWYSPARPTKGNPSLTPGSVRASRPFQRCHLLRKLYTAVKPHASYVIHVPPRFRLLPCVVYDLLLDLEAAAWAAEEEEEVAVFEVSGMTCAACAGSVEKAVKRLHGIHDAAVGALDCRAQVAFYPSFISIFDSNLRGPDGLHPSRCAKYSHKAQPPMDTTSGRRRWTELVESWQGCKIATLRLGSKRKSEDMGN